MSDRILCLRSVFVFLSYRSYRLIPTTDLGQPLSGTIFTSKRFGCSHTTNVSVDKGRPQADSAHQIGPETTLQDVLIVVESGGTEGRINAAGIFHSQKLGPILLYLNNQ